MANDQRDDEGPGIDWFTPWTPLEHFTGVKRAWESEGRTDE